MIYKSVGEILTEFTTAAEDVKAALSTLRLLQEHMDQEINKLTLSDGANVEDYLQRYPMTQATMRMSIDRLRSGLGSMEAGLNDAVTKIIQQSRKDSAEPPQV